MIVVGVDGSESARAALAWSLDEGRLRGDEVCVLSAWSFSPAAYGTMGYVPPVSDESFKFAAEQAVDETLDALADSAKGVRVKKMIVEGSAARVLVEAAKDADLLVVGSRGHGTLTGMLLGSVSHQVALHAECPVVIVRHGSDVAEKAD